MKSPTELARASSEEYLKVFRTYMNTLHGS